MKATIMRILRVLLGQVLGYLANSVVPIPYLGITVGVVLNGVFKFIRDKNPKSILLEYLPL